MPHCLLSTPTVDSLIADVLIQSRVLTDIEEEPRIVVSPLRDGAQAWQAGNWQAFGQMMNTSCQSFFNHYESGSEWLIAPRKWPTDPVSDSMLTSQ